MKTKSPTKFKQRQCREFRDFDPKTDGRTDQGPFMIIPKAWFQLPLKRDDVLLLAFLWNQWNTYKRVGELAAGGWFYCTTQKVLKELGMNAHAQARSLGRLEEFGLIQRKKDAPPKDYSGKGLDVRWIKVNRRYVRDCAAEVFHEPLSPAKSRLFFSAAEKKRKQTAKTRSTKYQ